MEKKKKKTLNNYEIYEVAQYKNNNCTACLKITKWKLLFTRNNNKHERVRERHKKKKMMFQVQNSKLSLHKKRGTSIS